MPKAARNTVKTLAWTKPASPGAPDAPLNEKEDVQIRRVTFNLPEPLYNDLLEFAGEKGDTMTGLFRWSFGLSKAIWDEIKEGSTIGVIKDGKIVKQFVITP